MAHRAAIVVGSSILIGALMPLAMSASQPGKPPPRGARIAIVAYHDSRLLTLCPVLGKDVIETSQFWGGMARAGLFYPPAGDVQNITLDDGDRRLARAILPLPAGRSAVMGPGASPSPPHELDRLARDPDVEQHLAERFRARRAYTVVDTPSAADFVFVVESTYLAISGGTGELNSPPVMVRSVTRPRPDTPERIFSDTDSEWTRRTDWSSWPTPSPSRASTPGGPAFIGVLGGDRNLNWRQSVLAVVVPASTFERHAGNGAELTAGAVWSGLVVSSMRGPASGASEMETASSDDLVDRFHARGQGLPPYLPVCAATPGVIRSIHDAGAVAPAAAGGGDPRPADGPEAPNPAGERDSTVPRFRADVTLVTVPVTVTDRSGSNVRDLPLAAFHAFEDDVEQAVERLDPGTVSSEIALVIDTSSGMRGPRESIRWSAAAFAAALRTPDRAMVVKFASRIQVLSELTADREALQEALARAGSSGGTRLYDALALVAVDRLRGTSGRKAVILLTDGRDTQSQLTNASGALAAMEAADAPVYVVRYETPDASNLVPPGAFGVRRWVIPFSDPQKDAEARAAGDEFLLQLAARTGGRLYAAREDADVPEIVADIARDLSNQQVLAYYPANGTMDGSFRHIRVIADCEGCTIRARPGYRAGILR